MSKPALRLGMIAALAAALQPWLLMALGEPDVSTLAGLAADPAAGRRVFAAMLLFMPPMFVAYWIGSLERLPAARLRASLALFAFALWFALELGPRSFDLWVVHARWLPAWTAGDPAQRETLEGFHRLYRDALVALGFVRRHALLAGQLCLLLAVAGVRPWGTALAVVLGASVLRLSLGSLATYADLGFLAGIADPLYYVTAGLGFPLLALWLWDRSRAARGRA